MKAFYLVNPQNLKENLFLIYLKTKKSLEEEHQKKKNYIDIEDLIIEY